MFATVAPTTPASSKVWPFVMLAEEAVIAALQVQQMGLGFESACKSSKLSREANHTMAGCDDGNRISTVRRANGPCSFWISELTSELTVGSSLSVRNPEERLPDLLLK